MRVSCEGARWKRRVVNSIEPTGIRGLPVKQMRRSVQIFGFVVLALAASGLGGLMAAALCPHARVSRTKTSAPATTAQACHEQPVVQSQAHCHDSMTAEQGEMEEMAVESAATVDDTTEAPARDERASLGQPAQACTHCMSSPESTVSTVVLRQQVETKRGVEMAAAQTTPVATPTTSFTHTVLFRQGAPPGLSPPRHLLISVFLI